MCKLQLFEQELKLRFAEQTVKNYSKQFRLFLDYFKGQDIRYLSDSKLKEYILFLHTIYGYSAIVHAISAIKFYYKHLNSRRRDVYLPLPPKPQTLPSVLSFEEVQKMIRLTMNLKHRAILETMFCHGLRRSELINLKITHIDTANAKNKALKVVQSKGLKDRDIPLSDTCLETLRAYYKVYRPKEYLFNGQITLQYSATSLANIIKEAAKRAGIKKKVTPHTLRHSFASYLVSIDVNLKKIQEWMGHASSKTTEIYCHLVYEDNPIRMSA